MKRFTVTTYAKQETFASYRLAKVAAKKAAKATRNAIALPSGNAVAIVSRRSHPAWRDGFSVGKMLFFIA